VCVYVGVSICLPLFLSALACSRMCVYICVFVCARVIVCLHVCNLPLHI